MVQETKDKQQIETALLIGFRDVLTITGFKDRSSIYRRMRRGEFPAAVEIGNGNVRWVRTEVIEWINALPRRKYYVSEGNG